MNNFKIGKLLGKGAFGSVSLVTRKTDGKTYAMKRVNIGKLSNKEKESSLNEIRILASLTHPNIIGYKEAFFDELTNTLNIVMEFADDGDLEKKIKNNLKKRLNFDENTIWAWVIQLLRGIKYLHDNRIMHRDLKCANIFLMKNGLLKLGDLNVSKFAKLGMATTQTGTPYYCSPEIWNEKSYDYKSDIWSLGCIIYEICSLRPPFRGTSLKGLKNNVLNGHYLPIPQIYSNELNELIAKMLVIDPSKRVSAGELLKEEIVINKMMSGKNIFENDIKEYNSEKANLIKTIRLPLNIKEINSKLPKKRYNPEEEMMKNDEYETMKQTFFQNLNEENNPKKEKGNFHRKNKKENGYNKGKENRSKKQLYKKNNIHEKNNNEKIKDHKIIENNNKNIININKSDNNPNKNYLNKREENKKNEEYIFNKKNLNYQYEQALKNNYKLKKFHSKQIPKKSEGKNNSNNKKHKEYIEQLNEKNNNYINKEQNNQNKKIKNVIIDNINNKNYINIDNQKYPVSRYNLILNNNQNNVFIEGHKNNRFKYLFNDDNHNNDYSINSINENDKKKNYSDIKKPLKTPQSAFQRQDEINLKYNKQNYKPQKRPITTLPSNNKLNSNKQKIQKKYSGKKVNSRVDNLYDKYKNKNKIEKNNHENKFKFKYVPQKRQVYKIDIKKINYNDYCKKNHIDRNKNYHYYRENAYYNYRNEMKKYGEYGKNKNSGNKINSNEVKNKFNNYLKNEYKGGGGAGYAARIRMQKNNK